MKKVLVIGCPGGGKTEFSKKLAKKTGLQLIHLDYYYHDKSKDYYSEANKKAWYAHVRRLMQGKSWIMDGNYSSTFPERFNAADTIFFFDLPLHSRIWGIYARRWRYRNKKRTDMPSDWQEKINGDFLWYVIKFRIFYKHKITDVLDHNTSKKVVTFKTRRAAEKYLDNLKPA